jgi:hypothetical protein
MFVYCDGEAPYKLPKIAENRAACGGRGSLAAGAVDTYRQKSLNCPKKKRRLRRISEVQPDLRESLIFPTTVKSSCAGPVPRPARAVGRRPRRPLRQVPRAPGHGGRGAATRTGWGL